MNCFFDPLIAGVQWEVSMQPNLWCQDSFFAFQQNHHDPWHPMTVTKNGKTPISEHHFSIGPFKFNSCWEDKIIYTIHIRIKTTKQQHHPWHPSFSDHPHFKSSSIHHPKYLDSILSYSSYIFKKSFQKYSIPSHSYPTSQTHQPPAPSPVDLPSAPPSMERHGVARRARGLPAPQRLRRQGGASRGAGGAAGAATEARGHGWGSPGMPQGIFRVKPCKAKDLWEDAGKIGISCGMKIWISFGMNIWISFGMKIWISIGNWRKCWCHKPA